MPSKLSFFVVHLLVHIFIYAIPRFIYLALIRISMALYYHLFYEQNFQYVLKRDRVVKVVSNYSSTQYKPTSCVKKFGLDKVMYYDGPIYNGHIHTLFGGARLGHRVNYHRQTLLASDGNPICLDWLHPSQMKENNISTDRMTSNQNGQKHSHDNQFDNCSNEQDKLVSKQSCQLNDMSQMNDKKWKGGKAILLIVPGIGNYGQSPYLQRLSRTAVKQNFHVCILTPRGMGSAPLTTPSLTCITFTSDLHKVLHQRFNVDAIREKFDSALPLFLLGFSAGGSTIIKCIAEQMQVMRGERVNEQDSNETTTNHKHQSNVINNTVMKQPFCQQIPLAACICVNSPYNVFNSTAALKTRIGLLLYQKPMLTALHKYYKKHRVMLNQGLPQLKKTDQFTKQQLITKLKTVQDFDKYIVAPHFGYSSPNEYYADSGAMQYLYKIKQIPIVCIEASDDPIVGQKISLNDWQQLVNTNNNILYVRFPAGGHLSCLGNPIQQMRQQPTYLQTFPLSIINSYLHNTKKEM